MTAVQLSSWISIDSCRMSWVLISLFLALLFLFLVWASSDISSGVYLKALCRDGKSNGVVYLTFDDGPEPVWTDRVLDVLAERGAVASFFVIGSKVPGNESLLKKIAAGGHSLGIHSYCHSTWFPLFRDGKMRADLSKCAEVISGAAGVDTKLFRPPFGVVNPVVARTVRHLGLRTIGWSVRTLDTSLMDRNDGQERILKRIDRRLADGAVILLHDRLPHCDELLAKVLDLLDRRGYRYDLPLRVDIEG
ncbi:MAG: polysaccharide deacetylase family protein [Candidatus Cryptobacteroides sp.]